MFVAMREVLFAAYEAAASLLVLLSMATGQTLLLSACLIGISNQRVLKCFAAQVAWRLLAVQAQPTAACEKVASILLLLPMATSSLRFPVREAV